MPVTWKYMHRCAGPGGMRQEEWGGMTGFGTGKINLSRRYEDGFFDGQDSNYYRRRTGSLK